MASGAMNAGSNTAREMPGIPCPGHPYEEPIAVCPADSGQAALQPRKHRRQKDLYTICAHTASLLHTRELRCGVTRARACGQRWRGSAAASRRVLCGEQIRTNVGRHLNGRPQGDFGWGEGQHAGRRRRPCELHRGQWHPDLLREARPRARCAVRLRGQRRCGALDNGR
jgi:hypothetical protein